MARCVQVDAALRCLCTLRSRQALDGPQARDFNGASASECVTDDDVEALTQEEVEMDLGSNSPLAPTRQLRLIVVTATGSVVVIRNGAGRRDKHGQLHPLYDVLPELTLPFDVLAGSEMERQAVQRQLTVVAPTLAGVLCDGYELVTMSPIFGDDRVRYSLVRLSDTTQARLQAHVALVQARALPTEV